MRLSVELGERIADKTVPKMMRGAGVDCGIRRGADCHRCKSCRGVAGETFGNAVGRGFGPVGRGGRWARTPPNPGSPETMTSLPRPTTSEARGWPRGRRRPVRVWLGMPRKGNCIGNGAAEQVFGHIRDEFSPGRTWPDSVSFKDASTPTWSTGTREDARLG